MQANVSECAVEVGWLSKRQHAAARPIRPIECHDGPLAEFYLALIERGQKGRTAYLWHERLTTEEDHTLGPV
jgi:hypothetical protein